MKHVVSVLLLSLLLALAATPVAACDPDTQNCGSEWSDAEWNAALTEWEYYAPEPSSTSDQPYQG